MLQLLLLSHLTDRLQLIKYANVLVSPLPVTTGVPDGCLLSLTLFEFIYQQFITFFLPAECVIAYADDVTLIYSQRNLWGALKVIQALLELICKWADSARLVLNVSKCAAMYVPYARAKTLQITQLPLFINGLQLRIPTVAEMKILGIFLTLSFDWLKQATLVRKNIPYVWCVTTIWLHARPADSTKSFQHIYNAAYFILFTGLR